MKLVQIEHYTAVDSSSTLSIFDHLRFKSTSLVPLQTVDNTGLKSTQQKNN